MALYLGKKRVAPSIQVKIPSMKAYFDAGGKCAYSSATSFEGIIKYEDTSNVTDMSYMFANCKNITSIPLLDTHNVTNISEMFNSCLRLKTIPLLDTSKVTNMHSMFDSCSSLTTIPLLDTSNVTDMETMFYSCRKLTTIPALNVSNVTNMRDIFGYCSNLEEVHMININANLKISVSTKFTREALVEIIGNLKPQTSGTTKTLTMGSTNLEKLTDADKKVATDKGWTLA